MSFTECMKLSGVFPNFGGSRRRSDCATPKEIMVSCDGEDTNQEQEWHLHRVKGVLVQRNSRVLFLHWFRRIYQEHQDCSPSLRGNVATKFWEGKKLCLHLEAASSLPLVQEPWISIASLHFCYPRGFHTAQRAIFSLQTLTHLPMDPGMGHIHCSTHVGGRRNAEEIAVWTQDHENFINSWLLYSCAA